MKKTFSFVFLAISFFMCLLVISSFVRLRLSDKEADFYGIYFGEDYERELTYNEYREEVTSRLHEAGLFSDTEIKTEEKSESFLSGLFFTKLVNSITEKVESYATANRIIGRDFFVLMGKRFDKLTGLDMTASLTGGQNSESDVRDVVGLTENGQLGWVQDDYDITEELENLVDLGLMVKNSGRNFLIAENPNKYAELDGFADYSEEKYAQIEKAMEEADLDYLKLLEALMEKGMTEEEMFFDTDFHWNQKAGLKAAESIAAFLNANYGYSIDTAIYEEGNYQIVTGSVAFLGHLGRKVTEIYTKTDTLELYYPLYETDFTVYCSYDGQTKTGSLEDTLFWMEKLKCDSLYDYNPYEVYGLSDQSLITIRNNKVKDGKKVLIIKESFANCVTPYLAAGVEALDIIDLRLFSGSIRKYIEETDPDTVIILYGLSSYENETIENSLFDFR